jgi:glycosyltransferase involved in cell wall biosynthesis
MPAGITSEYLFYPAQYWPHKNHTRLLEAVKILGDRYGWRVALVLCGADHGNLGYLRQRAAALCVSDRVHFLGFVTTDQLIALYRRAFALSFLSYFGPDNLPPLEAGALGCPVVTSAVEGAEEQLGSAALSVNPDSAVDVAAAMWRLKNEPGLRQRLVDNGWQRAARSTFGDYAASLIGVLDSLELRFATFRQ